MKLSLKGALWLLIGSVFALLLLALMQSQRTNANWASKWAARDLADQVSLTQAITDVRTTEQFIHTKQQEALNHAHAELSTLRDRSDDLRAQSRRLQSELDNAYTALASLGLDPVAVRSGQAASASASLLAKLHREALDHAGLLAATADECYIRGRTCELLYQSLSCKPP